MKTEKRVAKVGETIILTKDGSQGIVKKGEATKVMHIVDPMQTGTTTVLCMPTVAGGGCDSIDHDGYVVVVDDADSIKEELERARIEMHELAADFGLIHEKVIAASQRLDTLLNRHDAMRKEGESNAE